MEFVIAGIYRVLGRVDNIVVGGILRFIFIRSLLQEEEKAT